MLAVVFAIISIWAPQVRYANAGLAVWLFISAWALPTVSRATTWNNVLVAIVMFAASLLGSSRRVAVTRTGAPPPPP
jgi:hypothetical protein